ncbi:TniQ family protein [Nitrospirillum viridazoti]|nr:TniQ family protein [Nitrospirillum amazonense]
MLALTLPLGELETPASYCSRLAHRNGCGSAAEFCLDMGFTLRKIVAGDSDAFARLAEVSGADVEALKRGAFIPSGTRMFDIAGQTIPVVASRRNCLKVCPRCLAEDVAASPELKEAAPFQRVHWQVAWFRSCPTHRIRLVDLVEKTGGRVYGEVTNAIRPLFKTIADGGLEQSRSDSFYLEAYLLHRLQGVEAGASWLDGLQFHVAARLCEVVGAMDLFGRDVPTKTLDEKALSQSGHVGYDLLKEGLCEFLDKLRSNLWTETLGAGAKRLFGRLYSWLIDETENDAYKPLIDIVYNYTVENLPFRSGSKLLGRVVESPQMTSLAIAVEDSGTDCSEPWLRKVLTIRGLIGDEQQALSADKVLIPAYKMAPLLAAIRRRMPPKAAAAYLGVSKQLLLSLADNGLLRPFFSGDEKTDMKPLYDQQDLDDFLSALAAQALAEPTPNMCPIRLALQNAMSTSLDIVSLILEKRLKQVSQLPGNNGLLSFLVDPDEVRQTLWGTDLPLIEVRKIMNWRSSTLDFLVQNKIIPVKLATKQNSNRTYMVVCQKDLDNFNMIYVSIPAYMRETGRKSSDISTFIKDRGISPAISHTNLKDTPLSFFLRADFEE